MSFVFVSHNFLLVKHSRPDLAVGVRIVRRKLWETNTKDMRKLTKLIEKMKENQVGEDEGEVGGTS